MAVAKIIVDLSLDKAFDYNIPESMAKSIRIGSRVVVPFGRQTRQGYVLSISAAGEDESRLLKEIIDFCEQKTQLPEPLLNLGLWMSDYYCCAQEQAIRALLPGAVRNGKIKAKTVPHYRIEQIQEAQKFCLENSNSKKNANQILILQYLLQNPEPLELDDILENVPVSESTVKTLVKKNLLKLEALPVRRNPFGDSVILPTAPLNLSVEQQSALDKIKVMLQNRGDSKHVLLLHGVTNSGKTEVYLQAIAYALEMNLESVVLVPEISLTPQTVRRFRARFGDQISVLHSRLSDGERFDEWTRINNGEVKMVVGARSALFAPFRRLGLIIVDEEHEGSYKQSEAPRYHARDVAVMRGYLEKAVVVLGSATPSFESYFNALNHKYELAEMLHRVDDKFLPQVKLVDLRLNKPQENEDGENRKSNLISKVLIDAVYDRINHGEQVILFLNRRGFARQLMCDVCGFVASCEHCSVPYAYHKVRETLNCHFCGVEIPAPKVCPSCHSPEIRYSGAGTEKIESFAAKIFPGARIARMDSDSMRANGAHEKTLDKFKRGEIDILIGTQMIAKGLHFPNVTLVGVINADQGLYVPDFRSAERTFELLTQVAGRAGRGDVRGEVIVQTYNPNNDTIKMALTQDFRRFYDYDTEIRAMLKYPPYGHLSIIHFRSDEAEAGQQYAQKCMEFLRIYCHENIIVGEPCPSPIERIKGKFRFQIIFRGDGMKQLRLAMREFALKRRPPRGVDIFVDIDAQSLL